MIADDYAGSS